jgi:hypothetical protein
VIDIDTFRSGLQAGPAEPFRALDVDQVMVRGRRMRLRRRLLACGGAGGVAAAVLAVSAGAGWFSGPAPAPNQFAGAPAAAPSPSAPAPSAVAPSGLRGTVVHTGIHLSNGGEVVMYVVTVDEPSLPKVHFGVMAGGFSPDSVVIGLVMSNEVNGSDRAPGFHAVQAPTTVEAGAVPEFGYYVGPAAKITGTAGGHKVTAGQAHWSEDPSVVVFWFDPARVPGGHDVTGLTAYDAAGHRLTSGNTTIGHG